MLKKYEMSADSLAEDIIVTRAKFSSYYKIIIEGKKTGRKLTKKYRNFDDLLYQYIKLAIRCAYLEDKLEEMEENSI